MKQYSKGCATLPYIPKLNVSSLLDTAKTIKY